MALVTLIEAKEHLRITSTASDGDIWNKAEQASAIVLEYLDTRAHTRAVIASSSVASPTVITTEEAHGFVDGDTVIIAGHENSTPAIVGSYTVSNATEFTFTIPVNVTIAGTGGTAIVEWTSITVPWPVQTAVLLMLAHLYEHRGDDPRADDEVWQSIERVLVRSRTAALA